MATQTTPDSDVTELALEWTGQLSPAQVRHLLDQLGDEQAIRTLRVELATEQPDDLSARLLGHQKDAESDESPAEAEQGDASSDADTPEEETATESPMSDEEPVGAEDADGDETERVPRLNAGSTPFKLMRLLDAKENWLRTAEIREAIPDEWDVDPDTIGTNLWKLADRDLVEKRPYEEDNRQTEYRITALGQRALDDTFDRAEQQDHSDIDPLPDEKLAA